MFGLSDRINDLCPVSRRVMRTIDTGDIHPCQQQLLQIILPNDTRIQRHHDPCTSPGTRATKQGPASLGQQRVRLRRIGKARDVWKRPADVFHHML